MSYIENNLLPDERITYRTKLHWIIFVNPILSFILALIFLIAAGGRPEATALGGVGVLFLLASVLFAINRWIALKSSEFAVTNKRVLIKVGLVRRHSLELLLQKVEGIGVDQGLLGRLFGFGTIVVTGTGGTKEAFRTIAVPLEFRRQVQAQIPV